jgi:membrane fusion protein, heavy metal efflux system
MRRKGMMLIVLLSISGLQCSQRAPLESSLDDHGGSAASVEKDTVRLTDTAMQLAGIELEKVDLRKFKSRLSAMGKVLTPQSRKAIISHACACRVSELHVKIGDWVEPGDRLVMLECHEVGEAMSEFYKARVDLELAAINLAREKRLLKNGIGVQKNLQAVEAAHKIAQSTEEAAEKSLHVLGFTEEQVKEIAETHQINPAIALNSPIAGRVVSNVAVLGGMVDQLAEIFTIIDPRLLWVDAEVFEKDIAKVKVGQGVDIVVTAYPGEVFHGKITYIGDVLNEETRTITVRAEVANDPSRLKPGMFANVDIRLNGDTEVLVVPTSAVLEEGRRSYVFVKEEDCFRRKEIESGVVDGAYQEVLGGLQPGEEVVVQGNHQLRSELKKEELHQAHHSH